MDVRLKRCPCFLLGSFTCSYVLCQSIDSGWYWAIPFRQSTTDSVYCTCLFFLDGSVFASNAILPEKGGFVSFPFIFFRTHKPYLLVVSAARIGHCRPCPLHEQCQWHGTATKKPRRVSAVLVRTVRLLRRFSRPLDCLSGAQVLTLVFLLLGKVDLSERSILSSFPAALSYFCRFFSFHSHAHLSLRGCMSTESRPARLPLTRTRLSDSP